MPIDPLLPDDPDPARPARRLRVGSLWTGYGGLDLALHAVLGGVLVFVADSDRHIRAVLTARFTRVPNLGDITRVDYTTLAADLTTGLRAAPTGGRLVEVFIAGFPCQDISGIGGRAGNQKGNHSGLWFDVARAVRTLRPRLLVVENVAAIRYPGRGLDVVLGELAQAWGVADGHPAWVGDRRGGVAVGVAAGAQIRALGNGVVSLQAQTALRMLPCDAGLCVAAAAGPETAGRAETAGRWAA